MLPKAFDPRMQTFDSFYQFKSCLLVHASNLRSVHSDCQDLSRSEGAGTCWYVSPFPKPNPPWAWLGWVYHIQNCWSVDAGHPRNAISTAPAVASQRTIAMMRGTSVRMMSSGVSPRSLCWTRYM